MILATVGTQLPFPRLIDGLNVLATTLDEEIIAQVGKSTGDWPHLETHQTLSPEEFAKVFDRARVIVAHAGVGTILSAKKYAKPLILLPRRHALGEHRNDHQMATARQVTSHAGIYVAWDLDEMAELLRRPDLEKTSQAATSSCESLVQRVQDFITDS